MKIPYLIKIVQIYINNSTNAKTSFSIPYTTSKNSTEKNIYHLSKTNNHSNNMKIFSTANSKNKIIN